LPRPKGSKNKATLAREKAEKERLKKLASRTDEQIVNEIRDRFNIFNDMIRGTFADGQSLIQALIVSGAAGVGKSYTAEWALDAAKQKYGIKYEIVRGMISPIDLYELAYKMREPRHVIVLDDADAIFDDEVGLNLLKGLLDTSIERKVNWMTDHPRFKGEGALDKSFIYRGAILFLTNKDFQKYMDDGKGKYVPHMEALMSRSIYLDLCMHERREVALWARHLVLKNRILQDIGTTQSEEMMLMDWIRDNTENLRELSIRTAIKLARIFKQNPTEWKRRAEILLLRETV
jgi:hypothetical protein